MAYETILYEEEGPIGWLTLNRPHDGNMFNPTMCHEIRDCINDIRRESRTRVLVRACVCTRKHMLAMHLLDLGQRPRATSKQHRGPAARSHARTWICHCQRLGLEGAREHFSGPTLRRPLAERTVSRQGTQPRLCISLYLQSHHSCHGSSYA